MQRPYCEEHAERPAVARCAGCGKYLCRECLLEVGARPWCRECAAQASTPAAGPENAPEVVGTSREPGFPPSPEEESQPFGTRSQLSGEAPPAGAWAVGFSPDEVFRPPSMRETGHPDASGEPQNASSPTAINPPATPSGGGPVAARVVATCAYHPGVRAVTRCVRCGALICAGCRRVVSGKTVCETCHRASHAGVTAQAGLPASGTGPSSAVVPWKLWPGLAFLPVPFLLNGLMTYMMRQGDEISVGAAQLFISLLLYSSTLAFAFLVAYRYGSPLQEVGMNGHNLPSSLGLGLVGGSLAFWLAVAAGFMSAGMFRGLESVERWLQGFFDVNVKSLTGADVFIAGLIIIVAAPICEEIFFRGYLYPAMRNRMGMWGAVFLNGFLFSAVHFSVFGLIGRTLAGAIFCLLYEYNDNLWSPITAHALNNFVAFFLPIVVLWGS